MTAAERLNAILKANDVNICRREEIVKAFALECAVLDASAAEPSDFTLRELVRNSGWTWVRSVARAELTRREVKR